MLAAFVEKAKEHFKHFKNIFPSSKKKHSDIFLSKKYFSDPFFKLVDNYFTVDRFQIRFRGIVFFFFQARWVLLACSNLNVEFFKVFCFQERKFGSHIRKRTLFKIMFSIFLNHFVQNKRVFHDCAICFQIFLFNDIVEKMLSMIFPTDRTIFFPTGCRELCQKFDISLNYFLKFKRIVSEIIFAYIDQRASHPKLYRSVSKRFKNEIEKIKFEIYILSSTFFVSWYRG